MNLLPDTIEREYQTLKARLFKDLATHVNDAFDRFTALRQDARAEELMMLLGLTADQLLDREVLVRRLRQLAKDLNAEKIRQIQKLLGSQVTGLTPLQIEQWAEGQADIITNEARDFLGKVGADTAALVGVGTLAEAKKRVMEAAKKAAEIAEVRGSVAVLQLNSEIIEQTARSGGSRFYTWVTERDSKVRPHHAALDGTVQSWDSAPLGGGSNARDSGHPGSGYNCRCVPVPLGPDATSLERSGE
jgi:SPP1 gp7 family putative phage head morphogenesis protein